MSRPIHALICGGHNYADHKCINSVLGQLLKTAEHGLVIIQGGGPGAEALTREWAKANRIEYVNVPVDERRYGSLAIGIRNQRMIDGYRPHVVIAFPGSVGTADCVRRAQQAGINVVKISI